VAFRCKVDHRIDVVFGKNSVDKFGIANVAADKLITFAVLFIDISQIQRIAGIGQFVQIDYLAGKAALIRKEIPDKIAPDKAASAGYKNC
jgi:hypothetical protein